MLSQLTPIEMIAIVVIFAAAITAAWYIQRIGKSGRKG